MSIILGIDTSTTELGIGIVRDGEFVATYTRYIRHSHAEHISRAVSLLLDSSDIAPDEVTHCAVAAGPGSFTGLRIGLSFVKGFGIAGELQVMPCSSLLVLAHAGLPAGGPVIAAIDARRDEVFWALFTASGNVLRRESDDVLSSSSDFRSALPERCIVATDTMGYAASTVFSFLEKQALHRMAGSQALQRGLICAQLGAQAIADAAAWKRASEVFPSYLRSFPQAAAGKRAA